MNSIEITFDGEDKPSHTIVLAQYLCNALRQGFEVHIVAHPKLYYMIISALRYTNDEKWQENLYHYES